MAQLASRSAPPRLYCRLIIVELELALTAVGCTVVCAVGAAPAAGGNDFAKPATIARIPTKRAKGLEPSTFSLGS